LQSSSIFQDLSNTFSSFNLEYVLLMHKSFSVIDSTKTATEDLIQAINTNSADDAAYAVEVLTKKRTKIQLNLVGQHNDQEKSKKASSQTRASANVLRFVDIILFSVYSIGIFRLKLRVESHLDKEPFTVPISVCSGTPLRLLKDQVC
jgi:hypothetical protein